MSDQLAILANLRDHIRPLVLEPENPALAGSRIDALIRRRRWVWVLIIGCGTLFVICRTLFDYQGAPFGRYPHEIVWAAFLAFFNVSYLLLVTSILIFSKPVEKLAWQTFQIPVLLVLAYSISALFPLICNSFRVYFGFSYYSGSFEIIESIDRILSHLLFAVLYFLWLLRDWCKLDTCYNPKEATRLGWWMLVESFFVVMLLVSLTRHHSTVISEHTWIQWLWKHTTMKDLAIIGCLIVWWVWKGYERRIQMEWYTTTYANYLTGNINIQWKLLKTSEFKINGIIDFGCANGIRLKEFLTLFFPNGVPKDLPICGIDHNSMWKKAFETTFKGNRNAYFLEDARKLQQQDLAAFNFIHLSHMLYEAKTVKAVSDFLNRCNSGTLVLARGSSTNSFFLAVSVAYSTRIIHPTYSHLWNTVHLNKVMKACGLAYILNDQQSGPDFLIRQDYRLEEGGIDAAGDLIEFLYREDAAEQFRRFCKEKLQLDPSALIPNDDLAYLLRKL